MERILKTLAAEGATSSGRLHAELFGEDFDRDHFEVLLTALHRAGFIHIEEDSFETEGRLIEFRRPVITTSGRRATADDIAAARVPASGRSGRRTPRKSRRRKSRAGAKKKSGAKKRASRSSSAGDTIVASPLGQKLRGLRLTEAERRGIPAFLIFSDKVLVAIAGAKPETTTSLLEIKGVGPQLVKKYGDKILRIVAEKHDAKS